MEPVPIPDASAFMDTPPRGEGARELMVDLLPIAGATALSFAVPPLAPGLAAARVAPLLARLGMSIGGLLGLGARGATRFGPTVTAGGAGGATQAAIRGENIGEAALQSGAEMAAGEALGLGAVAGAARIAAPALGVITQQGRRALDFARKTPLPGSARGITGNPRALPISPEQVAPGLPQRAVQGLVDNLLPARLVAQERRRAVASRVLEVPPGQANEVIKKLINVDVSIVGQPRFTKIAERVSRALGRDTAARLGFESLGPRQFVLRAFERVPAAKLKKRLKGPALDNALTLNLAGMLNRATRKTANDARVIDGEALLAAWRAIPKATRELYPKASRDAIEGFAAFAAVSKRVPELAAQPTLAFDPSMVTASTGLVAAPVIEGALGAATAGTGRLAPASPS